MGYKKPFRALPILLIFFTPLVLSCASKVLRRGEESLLTRAEKSDFTQTTRYMEALEMLTSLQNKSPHLRMEVLAESAEGRDIPLAVLGKPVPKGPEDVGERTVVLLLANIHAGEVEGKEAVLILLRQILRGSLESLLDRLVILAVPLFNVDGNEKISPQNRPRQAGPKEGVGTRYNGQNLDLNRDFMKLEAPETLGLLKNVLNRWDPVLIVDCHTTNGSIQQEDICYSASNNPFCHSLVREYLWDQMLPAITKKVTREEGYTFVPYGYFKNTGQPEEGWETFSAEPRYSTNYLALRNRLAILDENYAYKDFKTRILACRAFLKSILDYAATHGEEMRRIVKEADRETAQLGRMLPETYCLPLSFEIQPWEKPIQVHGYRMEIYTDERGRSRGRKTDEEMLYTIPYLARFVPQKSVPVPAGYLFSGSLHKAKEKLLQHGIRVERLSRETQLQVEVFPITELRPGERVYQGHWNTLLRGTRKMEDRVFPAGTLYVGTDQPLGRLAAYLLEPESPDGLAYWNFLDRHLVSSQWTGRAGEYPVYRVLKPADLPRILEE